MEPTDIVGNSVIDEEKLDYSSHSLAPHQLWSNYPPQQLVGAHARDILKGIEQLKARQIEMEIVVSTTRFTGFRVPSSSLNEYFLGLSPNIPASLVFSIPSPSTLHISN